MACPLVHQQTRGTAGRGWKGRGGEGRGGEGRGGEGRGGFSTHPTCTLSQLPALSHPSRRSSSLYVSSDGGFFGFLSQDTLSAVAVADISESVGGVGGGGRVFTVRGALQRSTRCSQRSIVLVDSHGAQQVT